MYIIKIVCILHTYIYDSTHNMLFMPVLPGPPKATAMDDGSFTPRTERVTLGKGRFCTALPPLSGQIWVPNAPRRLEIS